jgi:hypothetical protein
MKQMNTSKVNNLNEICFIDFNLFLRSYFMTTASPNYRAYIIYHKEGGRANKTLRSINFISENENGGVFWL